MVRNHVVKFKVSESEWQLLRTNARISQIEQVSRYVRHVSLGRDIEIETRLIETTRLLVRLCKKLGLDQNPPAVVGRKQTVYENEPESFKGIL